MANQHYQQQQYTLAPYQRNPVNDPTQGFKYEDKVRLLALLNLADGQHLAIEMKDAPKFDDLVLFIEPTQPNHGYYFRQLKHNQNSSHNINWDHLFKDKKSKYYLPLLCEKFPEILNNPMFCDPNDVQDSWIRELSMMTNICFESNTLNTYFYEVTADSVWGKIAHKPDAKRYKFIKQPAMNALKAYNPKINKVTADKFFELLVFEVNYPSVESMDQELKTKMGSFFPLFNDQELKEATTAFKDTAGLSLFDRVLYSNNTTNWIKPSHRNDVFISITPRIISFGLRSLAVGEITYEQSVLQPLHETIEFSETYNCQTAHNVKQLPETVSVVNILCDPNKTLPTIASLKVYKHLTSINNEDGHNKCKRFEIMHVESRDQLEKIFQCVGRHCYEPAETFYIVIEMASNFDVSDFLSAMTSSGIVEKLQSWKNMKLAVISDKDFSKEIPSNVTTDEFSIKTISDNPLEWRDLCFDTRVFLFEKKTLFLEGNRKEAFEAWRNENKELHMASAEIIKTTDCCGRWKTSLKSLGLSNTEAWMDSLPLAELIIHNEQRPLCLGLPKYDSDLDTMYIDRKIKLPLFNTTKQKTYEKENDFRLNTLLNRFRTVLNTKREKSKEMNEELKQRLVYIEKECREEMRRKKDNLCARPFHLLTPVINSSVKGSHLWLTSSNERTEDNYAELKDHMIRSSDSDYAIKTESELLFKENVLSFGTLSASDDKLVIVVDLPGKGKTSLLTSLANQFLIRYQSKEEKLIDNLMLRVNLLDVHVSAWQIKTIENGNQENSQTDDAEKTKIRKFFKDEVSAIDFLVDKLLSLENEIKTSKKNLLSQKIIKQMCVNQSSASLFLLLDGFDEVSDGQRSVIYDLTNQLVRNTNGIKRIILTSRPDNGLEDNLEERFQQFALHLRNFDENDQVNFLVKRWDVKLHEAEKEEIASERITTRQQAAHDVRKYAEALVKYSQVTLKDEDRLFLDIPLQCMIISEVFFKSLVEHLEKCHKDPASTADPEFHEGNFAILKLYKQFYDTKIDILLENKAKIPKIEKKDEIPYFLKLKLKQKSFTPAVQRLSIFHMMKDIKYAELLCRIQWETYRISKYGDDLEQARRLGLIRAVDKNQSISEVLGAPHVKFIHRSFAEYFFAAFLRTGFIETKSELLDNNFYPTELLNETFRIIFKKIAKETEYAGILRFFDKMLADHVPHLGQEQCPFTLNKRDDVLKKWPVLTHEKCNTFLVEALTSPCSDMFKMWTDDDINQYESNEILRDDVGKLYEIQKKTEGWLLLSLLERNNSPLLITLLVCCIKEYASRREVSREKREALAHSVTLISLWWGRRFVKAKEDELRKMTVFLQWYDPIVGLSDSENRVFSKWFLKLLNQLNDCSGGRSDLAAFSLVCSRMKYHRHHLTNFQVEMGQLIESIFDSSNQTIANRFFPVTHWSHLTDDVIEAQKKGADFRDVFSLVTLVSPNDSSRLLKLQADWFVAQLVNYVNYLNEILQNAKFPYILDITNPFTMVETMEFLLKQLDELPNKQGFGNDTSSAAAAAAALETKQTIVESAWDYLVQVLPLLVRIISPECEEVKNKSIRIMYVKESIVSNLLWHLLMSDRIICHRQQQMECQTDDGDKSNQKAILEIFFTAVGRSVMIAFADASCCKCAHRQIEEWERNRYSQGASEKSVIVFLSDMYVSSGKTRKQFDKWLKNNLEIVWQEKTEIGFINFLVKNELKLVNDAVQWPAQEECQLNALPCLLLSDMVSAFIPRRLSQDGLEYFEKTIKNVHLPKDHKSLWDSITQRDFNCNHHNQAERFKEEFEKRKQELLSLSTE